MSARHNFHSLRSPPLWSLYLRDVLLHNNVLLSALDISGVSLRGHGRRGEHGSGVVDDKFFSKDPLWIQMYPPFVLTDMSLLDTLYPCGEKQYSIIRS